MTSPKPLSSPLLTVYTYDLDPKRHSFTSFAAKLQFRLRHASIPYETAFGNRNEAPKGKIPYVKFSTTNEFLGDSALIIKRLISEGHMPDLASPLSEREKAEDYCLRSMVEEKMYFLITYERFYENYHTMAGETGPFSYVPAGWGRRRAFMYATSLGARTMLFFQGTGRYSLGEFRELQQEAVGVLGAYAGVSLGKRVDGGRDDGGEPFWMLGGERPTEADFIVFGYLASVLATPTQPYTTGLIRDNKALMEYVDRIHRKYFPDFKEFPS